MTEPSALMKKSHQPAALMEDLVLTFDLGTTRLKVALFDVAGKLVGQVSRRNEDRRDGDAQWQSAGGWWQNCIDASRELVQRQGVNPSRIKGISLSGRAGAAVFVDAAGQVLCDPWSDGRHTGELRELLGSRGRAPATVYGPTLLAKLVWLRKHQPETAARVAHVLYAKDFLMYRLTGKAVTDPSSGPDGPWDQALLAAAGVDEAILPHPAMPWCVGGELRPDAATALGLGAGTPVAVGAHDGVCANTGAGSINPGEFAITLGTNAVVRAITADVPPGGWRFYGYPPDKHVIGGNAWMAGRSLDWFLDNWFDAPESTRQALFAELNTAVTKVPPGAGGVSFLPYLAGMIAPVRRPDVRATFHGMGLRTGRLDMYRAVLEGTAFAVTAVFEQVRDRVGEPTRIGVTGSGVASDTWLQILADVVARPLEITDHASEGRGAAIFCAVALGYYQSLDDAVGAMAQTSRTFTPDAAGSTRYRDIRAAWQSLSDQVSSIDLSVDLSVDRGN